MKKLGLTLVIAICTLAAFGQDDDNYDESQNMEVVTTREAQYEEGEQALYKYIFKNIEYSEEAKAAKVEGNVQVSFNVQPDGSVTNAFVLSGVEPSVDKEVVRLLKELTFLPAVRNGMKVKMNLIYNFPVRAH